MRRATTIASEATPRNTANATTATAMKMSATLRSQAVIMEIPASANVQATNTIRYRLRRLRRSVVTQI